MNSLSKVTLLVTLLTIPFAGFAMDSDVPALLEATTEKTADNAGSVLFWLGVAGAAAVAGYAVKTVVGYAYGKPANAEAKAKVAELTPADRAKLANFARQGSKEAYEAGVKRARINNAPSWEAYQAQTK